MKGFHCITPSAFDGVFDRIGKDWMLLTASGRRENGEEVVNTMTASWGGIGILWGKPVAFLFVRPQRFTDSLIAVSERMSISFFDEEYRAALRLCGTVSGAQGDKFAKAGLTPCKERGVPVIAEARCTLICRKLYADALHPEGFCESALLDNYRAGDYHRVYVMEIEEVWQRDER